VFQATWDDLTLYHLAINTGKMELQEAALMIVDVVRRMDAAKSS
jgi:cytidylate kinase